MEKLNEYLQTLLSSCSEELHLEPDRNPYLVSQNGEKDISYIPLLGTQISTLIFPLIPPDVKAALPHNSEVEFVHPHNLGNFNFTVQKSPSGFNVTIRPMMAEAGFTPIEANKPPADAYFSPENTDVPFLTADPEPEIVTAPKPERMSYAFESASAGIEYTSEVAVEDSVAPDLEIDTPMSVEYDSEPELEVVSANDPAFATVFSDTSNYEPPGNRNDFSDGEYVPTLEIGESAVSQRLEPPIMQKEQALHAVVTQSSDSNMFPIAETRPESASTSEMDELFKKMAALGCSDLHLSVSMSPMVRMDGKMKPLEPGIEPLTADAMKVLLTTIMPKANQEEFAERRDTDFAYEVPGLARFRCNIFMDRKGMGGVFRIIPAKMTTAESLGLSGAILDLCGLSKGMVVVTGPTGSGKSTTLCAMVNHINLNREDHIITIEDPIEFVHENIKCLVNQREVHTHTGSFKNALRAALREDPDILLVGEMRDLETIAIAIETAETGHLVFGTLHTTTAASTVDRIIDQFPADRQQQIRVMLSESLKGVIAQTLLPKKGGGRVAALEVLIVTPAISNLIREGKTFQIPSAMQTGKNHGMVMLNDSLFELVKNGIVEPRDAYSKAVDRTNFETMLTRGGFSI